MAHDSGIGDQIIRQFEVLHARIEFAIDALQANRDHLPTPSMIGESTTSHAVQRDLCHECIRLEVALEEATQSMERLVAKSRGITFSAFENAHRAAAV